MRELKSAAILPSAAALSPPLAELSAPPRRPSAASAEIGATLIVRTVPGAPPVTAGTDVLPSAPKASETTTLIVYFPAEKMIPLTDVSLAPDLRRVGSAPDPSSEKYS